MLPCLLFEDEHLLVINKPAGLNTHAPSPYAGEGLYDWLRHREPRWASLAIVHRLDKETSGVIVFSKTSLANRSLTEQFTRRAVRKKYLLLTDAPVSRKEFTVNSFLVRAGEKYVSRPERAAALGAPASPPARERARGAAAETRFRLLDASESRQLGSTLVLGPWPLECRNPDRGGYHLLEAEPLTGRTHQIRVHAAEKGLPILGDVLYGGTPAPRVYLHAAELTLKHPASNKALTFRAPIQPIGRGLPPALGLRAALLEPDATNAYRVLHGATEGWPGWYVERFGDYLLSESDQRLSQAQREELARLMEGSRARGAYHKVLTRRAPGADPAAASPQPVLGEAAPERFMIRENGLEFEVSFNEGYSVGLFLDQRDNRRRVLTGHVAAGFPLFSTAGRDASPAVLNTFAYTCGFSVCAAQSGARTTSLDLSNKYLEWGRRNFALNQIDPAGHEFIHGDIFAGLRRLARQQRSFDLILLDPPTFSRSKESGVFRVEKDYGKLVAAALPLLRPGGVLFASTNAAGWPPEAFLAAIERAIRAERRKLVQRHYVPQPPDFPISRAEPAYLKTVWLRVE